MIHICSGNLFESDAVALVNPVNCVGVMETGLGVEFKRRYPAMFAYYTRLCRTKRLHLGIVQLWVEDADRFIVLFPTKQHWRDPSDLADIRRGLLSLRQWLDETDLDSVAIPAGGAGLGSLDWSDVKATIEDVLGDVEADIQVFLPHG